MNMLCHRKVVSLKQKMSSTYFIAVLRINLLKVVLSVKC